MIEKPLQKLRRFAPWWTWTVLSSSACSITAELIDADWNTSWPAPSDRAAAPKRVKAISPAVQSSVLKSANMLCLITISALAWARIIPFCCALAPSQFEQVEQPSRRFKMELEQRTDVMSISFWNKGGSKQNHAPADEAAWIRWIFLLIFNSG